MKQNVGTWDRILRLVVAVVAGVAGYMTGGALGWVLYAVAAVMLFTAVSGWCALYAALGINTGAPAKQ